MNEGFEKEVQEMLEMGARAREWYKKGVLSFIGYSPEIHLDWDRFREIFGEQPICKEDDTYVWVEMWIDKTRFVALKEKKPMENADGFNYSPEERGLYGCEFTVKAKAYGPETGYVVEGELWSNGTVEDFKIVVFEEALQRGVAVKEVFLSNGKDTLEEVK